MDQDERSFCSSIGRKIKLARMKKNYTQEYLAEKLQLSSRYISQLERGLAFGSAKTVVNLCNALSVSPDFLFYDLIKHTSSDSFCHVDDKFLLNYAELSEHDKDIIHMLAEDLVRLQKETELKNKTS